MTTYKTKDLAEAAALIACKQPLIDIERINGICYFVFGNASSCEELSREYFYGILKVEAMEYQQALKRLKNNIYNPLNS